ncbi:hypothetical protein J2I47_03755 [Fibrella sp. HMF5335]|uniref:Uncharacterized protein n=1 Tax=Fibrella rubiginis TaxID=2817060 RepID=A0A939GF53_9BACT|nr:hypothetical protein [Fibrella rubiginis]MBO0935655.1 hypothetical protein [Fibrella rubiginis]
MTLNVGYALSSLLLIGIFVATLIAQLSAKRYIPVLYWSVILSTSTAGTTMSDYMDRTLGLGYAMGSLVLVSILVTVLVIWYRTEKSLSVTDIKTTRPGPNCFTGRLFCFPTPSARPSAISWPTVLVWASPGGLSSLAASCYW